MLSGVGWTRPLRRCEAALPATSSIMKSMISDVYVFCFNESQELCCIPGGKSKYFMWINSVFKYFLEPV